MVLASFGKVMSVIGPVALASAGLYYIQRGIWPLGRTLNNEWFAASEQMMTSMPRQGSDKPVRLNPMSAHINMRSVTY
ncbi:serine hydrolase [Chlorella sorokiniana]|uniref:Serine hydrolase n=1 Tax=Chlorella sorokiniana TaxID=3076 RepID=A0A2P6TW58_CHLSO|nr:serine hydrolase [Chlorella sorokiniana]|eukprot:PRW58297.1 serine hydrolase [Chlorella sorokiniana]